MGAVSKVVFDVSTCHAMAATVLGVDLGCGCQEALY